MQSVKLLPQSTATKRNNKKLSAVGGNQSKYERNERAAISAHYRAYKACKTNARGFFFGRSVSWRIGWLQKRRKTHEYAIH